MTKGSVLIIVIATLILIAIYLAVPEDEEFAPNAGDLTVNWLLLP